MTFSKSQIFTAAWELARAYAAEEGTGSKAQFARALRETYASVRVVEAQAAEDARREAEARTAENEEWAARQEAQNAADAKRYGWTRRLVA